MQTVSERCPCVCEREANPYKSHMCADPRCTVCGGEGLVTVRVGYDPPPVPFRGADWRAIADIFEEEGLEGRGATQHLAVDDLMMRIEERM